MVIKMIDKKVIEGSLNNTLLAIKYSKERADDITKRINDGFSPAIQDLVDDYHKSDCNSINKYLDTAIQVIERIIRVELK